MASKLVRFKYGLMNGQLYIRGGQLLFVADPAQVKVARLRKAERLRSGTLERARPLLEVLKRRKGNA